MARRVSELGECDRKKVGAVITDTTNDKVISIGYNAPPKHITCTDKLSHINDGGCLCDSGRCMKAVHAEQQALLGANQTVKGLTLYCTDEHCEHCTRLLLEAGIKRVVFENTYTNPHNHHFIGDMEWVHHRQQKEK